MVKRSGGITHKRVGVQEVSPEKGSKLGRYHRKKGRVAGVRQSCHGMIYNSAEQYFEPK